MIHLHFHSSGLVLQIVHMHACSVVHEAHPLDNEAPMWGRGNEAEMLRLGKRNDGRKQESKRVADNWNATVVELWSRVLLRAQRRQNINTHNPRNTVSIVNYPIYLSNPKCHRTRD